MRHIDAKKYAIAHKVKKRLDEKFLEFAITLEVSKFINSPLNQPNTLEVLFNTFSHKTDLDTCALTFIKKDKNELFITSKLNLTKDKRQMLISRIRAYIKKINSNEIILKNIKTANLLNKNKLAYLKNIPIISNEETLGVLTVVSFKKAPSEKDLEFLDILAKDFSLFLENDKHKQDLADEKNIIESIVQSMTEGVIFIDNSHKIAIINNAAKSILDIEKDIAQKSMYDHIKNHAILNIVRTIENKSENSIYKEIVLGKENSKEKIIRCVASKTFDGGKNPLGITLVLTDITHEKEADEARTEFLSTASHELRTPLSAIKQSLNLLREDQKLNFNREQKSLLSIAGKNINRLSGLINNLLDLTKIESGKMKFSLRKTNLPAVIEESIATFNLVAKEKQITIKTKFDKNLPPIFIDKPRIIQVFANLLSNAVKFTPSGGKIAIESRLYPMDKNYIEVSVKDTGVGIDKKDMPNLFKKFQQFSASSSSQGTGLGLAITKDIINLHNGYIWVESAIGKGSKFAFILPVERRKSQ